MSYPDNKADGQACKIAEIVGPIADSAVLQTATPLPSLSIKQQPNTIQPNATVVFDKEKKTVKTCGNAFYPGTTTYSVVVDLVQK